MAKKTKGSKASSEKIVGKEGKLHLHIENNRALGPVFETTKKRLAAALKAHPKVAAQLKVTIGYDGDVLEKQLKTADVLFGWRFDRADLATRAPRLRWVHAHGAGVNHLMPLTWLPPGAVLTNSRGVHGDRAGEYLMMAILMLNNRVPEMITNQRRARWEQLFNSSVAGKTLLVIGVGSVGGNAAGWAKKFGMRVLGIRRTGEPHKSVDTMHKPAALKRLLPKADIVLMTAPHTVDTDKMLGAAEIALIKPGAGLINYSRANLVDYDALRERLDRREISAVLDVFDPEPLPSGSPLWNTPNLVMTPHASSDDSDAYTPGTLDLVLRNMARFIAGKKLKNVVDPKLQY